MKNQAFNPYLPETEYVPDGEPHVFGERIYVYGSHDRFGGAEYCELDYVCWSAPVDDLSDWACSGVIYARGDDPDNADLESCLYAPDVARGPNGRFYLYYALHKSAKMSVAVCDKPDGRFKFLGYVSYPDGTPVGTKPGDLHQFDPGIFIDDDKKIYLYSGFSGRYPWTADGVGWDGAYVMELEPDMLTLKEAPKLLMKGGFHAPVEGFEGHEFFEASSMRKHDGKYYFVYSSIKSHELCYAVSGRPEGGFAYGGTIVSIGDIGLGGRAQALNYMGNTHGSIVNVNGKWYVFYHRHTNSHQYSRQACAERIEILPDGTIPQVEITSCGLNGGPLAGRGTYPARIACNLCSCEGAYHYEGAGHAPGIHPYFTQQDGRQYIANFTDGAVAGFKYFEFAGARGISITVRGDCSGTVSVYSETGGEALAEIAVEPSDMWAIFESPLAVLNGVMPLYFKFNGKGGFDFLEIGFGPQVPKNREPAGR
jgi:hypothetical protein